MNTNQKIRRIGGIVVLLIVGGIIFGCRIDHQATKEADEKNNSAVK